MPIPIKLNQVVLGSTRRRLDWLRQTIPTGQGLTMEEVGAALGVTGIHAGRICRAEGWSFWTYNEATSRNVMVLVSPKDQKRYARAIKKQTLAAA